MDRTDRKAAARRGITRARALELERLVDAGEWCQLRGIDPLFPFPAAMTRELCDAIEEIPFAQVGIATAAERGRLVLERGAAALERCLRTLEEHGVPESFSTQFAAPLRCRAGDKTWRMLSLYCGPGDDQKPVVTLALADEY